MYPQLKTRTEADGEDALHPEGWEQRLYTIGSGPLRFTKHTLELGEDLFLEENHLLEGSIRVDGVIGQGRLQIALLHSDNYRVLGYAADGRLQTVSYDGSSWDVAASAPASAFTFNATARFFNGRASLPMELLKKRLPDGRENRSLIIRFTSQSETLDTFMRGAFHLAKSRLLGSYELALLHHDLSEIVCALLDEIADVESLEVERLTKTLHSLGQAIEELLWVCPTDSADEINLDFLTHKFGCSRRYIQMAVSETFGLSFTNLKRCIRLHQARKALRGSASSITDVALKHEFEHLGRFAAYYRNLFGVLPGLDRSGSRLDVVGKRD